MMDSGISEYFSSYEDLEVHELMLRDSSRQSAYYNAVMKCKEIFKDKVVMDVGAGTGILSAFCAKAGAKLVYAVEASNLARIAIKTMEENSLTGIVKVIQSKVEDFRLPTSSEKVDIIISEWMGFYLLHEGMLDSVIFARDHFLKEDGQIFPESASLVIAPCSIKSLFDDWQNVNGISMTHFSKLLRSQKSSKPQILSLPPDDLLHQGVVMHWFNLKELKTEDLDSIVYKDVMATEKSGKLQGFCLWFDCQFPNIGVDLDILSTAPQALETHWKQCLIILPDESCREMDENEPIAFQISILRKPDEPRKYNIEVELLDPNVEEHPLPCQCHFTKCILTKAHLQTYCKDSN